MKIKIVSGSELGRLRAGIEDNLHHYRDGIPFTFSDVIDTGVTVPDFELLLADEAEKRHSTDALNILLIYRSFCNLPASIIRDERFWTYLTHGPFISYSASRWPLPSNTEKALRFVKDHYFTSNGRGLESRNAVSRLYWIGRVAERNGGDLDETVRIISKSRGLLNDIIERPELLQVPSIFRALFVRLAESDAGDQLLFERKVNREVLKSINVACGSTFVECLSFDTVQALVDEAIEQTLDVLTDP